MPLTTIEPQRLYLQIAGQLRQLMTEGEFAVGSRLPAERDLAKQLGVSRPSVREALIALEVQGLIEVRTGSGIYVRPASAHKSAAQASPQDAGEWGPLELMSARQVVEAEVAAMAARHANRTQTRSMRSALKQMREAARRSEVPRAGDQAFHEAIAKACGNSVLLDIVQRLWQAREGPLFERLGSYFEHPQSWQDAIEEHQRVLDAIEANDPGAARRAMQRHLRQAHNRYSASWRRAPVR